MKIKIEMINKNSKIENKIIKISGGIALVIFGSGSAFAQLDEDITIKKDRKIELAPANRVLEKFLR